MSESVAEQKTKNYFRIDQWIGPKTIHSAPQDTRYSNDHKETYAWVKVEKFQNSEFEKKSNFKNFSWLAYMHNFN